MNAGASVTFSVVASGSAPLSYQWKKDGTNLTGVTGTLLALANIQESDQGIYTVVVDNAFGSTTSADALLIEVHPNPAEAWSDGAQQVSLEIFAQLMRELRPLLQAVGRE